MTGDRSRLALATLITNASLAALSVLTLLLFLSWVILNLSVDGGYLWAAARLTPLIGLFHGYELYSGAGDGPLQDAIYGPLAYLPFAPAALAATPTSAVLIGQFTAIALGLTAAGALLLAEARRSGFSRWRTVCLGLNVLALLALFVPSGAAAGPGFLAFMTFGVHADAPALAFATLACCCVYGQRQAPGYRALVACTTWATLAVWAKQTEVGIFPALGLYLLAAFGVASLARFVGVAAAAGAGISTVLLAVFGARNTLFNLFVVPSHHPLAMREGGSLALILEVLAATWLLLVVAAGAVILKLRYQQRGSDARADANFAVRNPWVLLLLAALCSVPTSILGSLKVGGLANSYHFAYYLALLAALLFASLGGSEPRPAPARGPVLLPPLLLILALLPPLLPQLRWLERADRLRDNSLEQAYQYAREHPGSAYFPWMPLSSLLAEGRLYHYDYGLFDWELAGFTPSVGQFRRHIPAGLAYVFYPVTAPAPSPYRNDEPPAVQFLPECAYLGDGGPMQAWSGNWRAWKCP